MDRRSTAQMRGFLGGFITAVRPHLLFGALVVGPLGAVALLIPAPLVLPVVSLIAIVAAAIASLYAWRSASIRDHKTVTAWDVAGACTLIGCIAATLSEPEHVVRLMEMSVAAN